MNICENYFILISILTISIDNLRINTQELNEVVMSIIGLIVALLALLVAISGVRYQLITMINSQLADKAKECNGNLNSNDQPDWHANKLSGLVSSIITTKQLLDSHFENKFLRALLLNDKQIFINQFYLQLHTSVIEFLKEKNFNYRSIITDESDKIDIIKANDDIKIKIIGQRTSAKEILSVSILKYNPEN
jgi:hypothetical protein